MVNGKHKRLGARYWKAAALIFVLFPVIIFGFLALSRSPGGRLTFVVAGSPMAVVSWDRDHERVLLIEIPSSVVIAGVSGVGNYSLEALWQLGAIDKKDQALLPHSLEDALGVPVSGFIGWLSSVRDTFTFANLLPLLTGRFRTNFSPFLFFSFTTAFNKLRPDAIETLRVGESTTETQTLPDGSTVKVFSPARFDALVGTRFEDEGVRKESLRVEILNTTQAPSLGKRLERQLNHVGALVVGVGNDTPEVDQCQVEGEKKFLETKTVRFIMDHFGCKLISAANQSRADVVVRIGSQFRKRF